MKGYLLVAVFAMSTPERLSARVAQAIAEDLTLLTTDGTIPKYASVRVLRSTHR